MLGATQQSLSALALTAAKSSAEQENPFAMPTDEELFLQQDKDRQRRAEQLILQRTLSVRDKTTLSADSGRATIRAAGLEPLKRRTGLRERNWRSTAAGQASPQATLHGREKENIKEFLAKKREIFLVQMSLDTKRGEMVKLEERSAARAAALAQAEAVLEEDSARFDAFLKENDERVQEALRKADAEARARQDKVTQLKRVHAAIEGARSELAKAEEQLEECRRYRAALDAMTPREWVAQQEEERAAAWQDKLARWQAECAMVRAHKADAREAKAAADAALASARTQQEAERGEAAARAAERALREALRVQEPPAPLQPPPADSDDAPCFFQEPQQLFAVYAQLEERNLFLIQNAQEAEEGLEKVKLQLAEAQQELGAEAAQLAAQQAALEARLVAQRRKCQLLQERAQAGATGAGSPAATGVAPAKLAAKVREVWARCGGEGEQGTTPMGMLSELEAALEAVLASPLSPEQRAEAERGREKDRRQVAREKKVRAQQAEHEARARRALERAAAPVFRKQGKPAMFRSRLPKRVQAAKQAQGGEQEAELDAYLVRSDIL